MEGEKKKRKYVQRIQRHCRECKKLLSIYNKGKYCFACNKTCFLRDEALVDEAKKSITASENTLRFLNSPKRVAANIRANERNIATQKKLIKKISAYEYTYVEEENNEILD